MPGKSILVADDDQIVLDLLKEMLRGEDYRVFLASNGKEAIETTQKNPIDVAILDIKMPAGGGIGVYENLKKSTDTMFIPVIFITAHAGKETRKKILEMGAKDFINKPFKADELLGKIKKALEEADPEKE